MTAWSIWNQRNQVRMHTPCYNMNRIAQVSKERLEEFTAVIPQTASLLEAQDCVETSSN